jgi:hypothetical protein
MKLTLLDIVQDVLSALDSDEVNSISDTVESNQVARIVRRSYNNIKARANLPEHRVLFTLRASNVGDLPVLMYAPDHINRIDWIKYNIRSVSSPFDNYAYVTILPISQFLEHVNQFNSSESDVESFVLDDTKFYFKNDVFPHYCTIIKDSQIVFDSFDEGIDTTLQESKSLCYGLRDPIFEMSDTFIPDLDEQQVALLVNESISLAYMELKQIAHPIADRDSRRQWNSMQVTKDLVKPNAMDQFANFGRFRTTRAAFPFRRM